jgi:hypothetical protein
MQIDHGNSVRQQDGPELINGAHDPTGPGHGVYKDTVAYGIFCGEWCIRRIYATRIGSEQLRWFWALHAPSKSGALRTDNSSATP